jgi:ribosomal-protein-alanine N-acetyltransferase
MKAFIQYGETHRIQLAILDVRSSNQSAKNLYANFGFIQIGVRKKYYSDNQEDAIMMMRKF